jgi:hypothetical protein
MLETIVSRHFGVKVRPDNDFVEHFKRVLTPWRERLTNKIITNLRVGEIIGVEEYIQHFDDPAKKKAYEKCWKDIQYTNKIPLFLEPLLKKGEI